MRVLGDVRRGRSEEQDSKSSPRPPRVIGRGRFSGAILTSVACSPVRAIVLTC